MTGKLVQIKLSKIMQTRTYTAIVIGTDDKRFAIYAEPSLGKVLQLSLSQIEKPRPLTHDLLSSLLKGLQVRVKQVVINDLQDTVYFARLFLEKDEGERRHIVELDARPSDCLTLALLNNVPLYCTQDVLDKAIPIEE
jgi:uncharacterized protein